MAERKPSDDKAAFGVFPQMKGKRSRQDPEAAKNVPVDLARGFVAGALGMPGDVESLIRMLPGLDEKTILPTSEDIEKRLPFRSDTPASRAASGLGILGGGFYTGPGSAARAITAVPKAVKRAGEDFVQAAGKSVSPLTVYHGSPHKFDKFDASKIGTGEGAQAYGHGLYLAQDRGIADVYRKKLTGVDGAPVVNPNESLQVAIGRLQSKIDKLRQSDDPSAPAMIRAYEGRIKELDNAGSLYTVDLPDDKIARMLDWDKPLSEQPEVIRALKGTDYEVGMSQREAEKLADIQIRQEADDWAEMTGGDPIDYSNNVDWEKYVDQIRKESGSIDSGITGKDLHRMIMRDEGYRPELFDPENYQVGTSEVLRGYDIPGIKYLDANSRDLGKGTQNFVVFPGEEDALTILDRKKEGGVVISSNPDTMMLEVNNKRMQAGGLAKGLKALVKTHKKAVPLVEAPSVIIPSGISSVKEALRKSEGAYGVRRIERAADEVKNLEKLYNEKALREAFLGDNAKAVVTMNPADFERYAQELRGRTRADIGPKAAELAKQGEIDKYTVPTDEYIQHLMRVQGGFDQVPYLNLYKDEVGIPSMPEVRGHEGRHRSRALSEAGESTGLVQISPRGDLREGLPRRSQEEYIEALREELERSGRLVLPEVDGSYRRPAVELPEPYAEGGSVHMQAGGLAKLLRAAPKSKAEIEAIAERMAPQMLGEFVRGDKGTQSVAGKTQKQFAKEKDMTVDVRPTKGQGKAPKAVSIEELKDQVMIGIPGDPTIANKTLYGINDMRLDSPSPQHGGPLYGLEHEGNAFWASGLGAANRVQNLAREAGQQYDMPVLGNYIMMGPESINYAQHFADANLSAIDPTKMSKAQIEAFNNLVREGYPYVKNKERFQRVFPAFPGIENPSEAYLHFAIDPELRKHFNALMQMPTVTEKYNLPSGTDVRFAITEPDLRDLETGVTGKSIGRMRPEVVDLNLSSHPTYSHDIPGEFLGSSNYPMPYELSFPDTVKAIRENPKQAPHEFGSLKMVGPRQVIDQQMIDEIRQYEEMLKRMTGMAAGGVVNSLAKTEALAKLAKLREEMAIRSEAVKNLTAKDENKYLSDVTPNSLTKAEIEAEIARMKARVQPEVKKADGGAIDFNTTPDTSDKGRIMGGAPFKHGGKVSKTPSRDMMFLELSNKKLKRK